MRTAPESVDDINDKTKTGVTFSELQLEYVKKVREAVAVAMADDDNELDTALMGLIISFLAQDTSQLLLYESPVMYYLAVRSVNPQTEKFYPSF